jgi:hypothetical protein
VLAVAYSIDSVLYSGTKQTSSDTELPRQCEQPPVDCWCLNPLRLEAGVSGLRTESSLRLGGWGSPSAIPIPTERTGMAPRILCVASNLAILENRCEALKASSYDVSSATPQVAESLLLNQTFDLIVVSGLSGFDLQKVNNLAGGADMLVLSGLALPSEMLFSAGQLLDRQESA